MALTSEAMVLRGVTKVLGRARRFPLSHIESLRLRERNEFPDEHLPAWGLSDDGVWYTRDRHRWRCRAAIELTLVGGDMVGFTPAHPHRVRDLLTRQGVREA